MFVNFKKCWNIWHRFPVSKLNGSQIIQKLTRLLEHGVRTRGVSCMIWMCMASNTDHRNEMFSCFSDGQASLLVQCRKGLTNTHFCDSCFCSASFPVKAYMPLLKYIVRSVWFLQACFPESTCVDFIHLWLWPTLFLSFWVVLTFKMWHLFPFQIFPSTSSKALLTTLSPSNILNKIHFFSVFFLPWSSPLITFS